MSGDLFVHLFSSLHFITSSLGPTKISAMGCLRFWKDGREVPDVLLGMFDYPNTDKHPGFNLSFSNAQVLCKGLQFAIAASAAIHAIIRMAG